MPRPGVVKEFGTVREHGAQDSSVAMLPMRQVLRTMAPEELRHPYLIFNRQLAKTDSMQGHKQAHVLEN